MKYKQFMRFMESAESSFTTGWDWTTLDVCELKEEDQLDISSVNIYEDKLIIKTEEYDHKIYMIDIANANGHFVKMVSVSPTANLSQSSIPDDLKGLAAREAQK